MSVEEARILLVEDNHTDAEIIAEALKDTGLPHQLDLASDGVQALEALADEQPHLVLLDLNLPKKQGLEVLREIKQDTKLCTTPVVILTNSESEKDVIACYESFCTAYVRKPLQFEDWVAALNCISHMLFRVVTLPHGQPLPKQRGCSLVKTPRLSKRPPPPKKKCSKRK